MVWIETCDHHPYARAGRPVKLYMLALTSPTGYYAGFICPACGYVRKVSGRYDTIGDLHHDWQGYVSNLTELALYGQWWIVYRPVAGLTELHRLEVRDGNYQQVV